jgi:GDP-D-mannose dehydratase
MASSNKAQSQGVNRANIEEEGKKFIAAEREYFRPKAAAVLLSNVRATFLAARWMPVTEDEDRPARFNETFRDKPVDQLPPRA